MEREREREHISSDRQTDRQTDRQNVTLAGPPLLLSYARPSSLYTEQDAVLFSKKAVTTKMA